MSRKRQPRAIETIAPTADAGYFDDVEPDGWPASPPEPLKRHRRPPLFRPLKVYAFGPSLGRTPFNVRTLLVPYEPLAPGPVGERVAIVDYDSSRDCFYDPVNLDDPLIAVNGGLDPSESDPQFHQQMAYALVSDSLHKIEIALGRTVRWRSKDRSAPLKIVVHPHAGVLANAFFSGNRMLFGYFRADASATGRTLPGQTVFTCLSADVVVHQSAHALLTATRPDLSYGTYGQTIDNMSLHEALADLTPLLLRLSYRDAVLETIHLTAGVIYRSNIVAELRANNPLLVLSQDFGDAIGRAEGLREALASPDPSVLERDDEPHARGNVVVAAVFDALFSIYQRRTVDLFKIYRAGGVRFEGSDIPESLANRLCDEVERIAARVFNMCWRAIDYCPPASIELGDFLRACITADYEYSRDDPWGLRDAMMQAFRLRGIKSSTAPFFTEEALRWPVVEASALTAPGPRDLSPKALQAFAAANAATLGLSSKAKVHVYPIEQCQRGAPDEIPKTTYLTQLIVHARDGKPRSGTTVIFDALGHVRYAIRSSPVRRSGRSNSTRGDDAG